VRPSPDANELWQTFAKFLRKVSAKFAARPMCSEGRNLQLGFAPGEKAMMDIPVPS
jgi:hypothetical protein